MAIIKLKTGKALGAFPGFVETFNWLVDFCSNLKGSGDEYNSTGSDNDRNGIVVDRSVPDHPVIRGGGSDVSATSKKITLESGYDSNLKFVTQDNADETKIVIDVYYK